MTPISITDGTSQPLTASGVVSPTTGLDISGLSPTSDYMLEIEALGLSSNTTAGNPPAQARVTIEDTLNAFTAAVTVCEVIFAGPIAPGATVKQTWKSDRVPTLRLGQAGAKVRCNVVMLNGTTPSFSVRAALWN
jgi:hypothetical protein